MALTITKDRNIERMVQIIPFLIHSLTYRLPPHRVPIAVDGICPPARTKWRGQRYHTLYTKAMKKAFFAKKQFWFCYDLVVVVASGRIVFVITATIFSLNLNSPPVCFARVINSDQPSSRRQSQRVLCLFVFVYLYLCICICVFVFVYLYLRICIFAFVIVYL